MPMNRDQFNALVAQCENASRRAPALFKWRVGAMAGLGIGFLLLILALSILCTAGMLYLLIVYPRAATLKLALFVGVPSGAMSWAIIRSLFVKLPHPEGRALAPEQVPQLFAMIDEVRRQVGGPAFHRVLLTPDHNAAVVQRPRLGAFGWYQNTLLLGLPLLQGISVEEFRAVLAHEFAHLSNQHGKFGAWIYRLRRVWEQLINELERQQRGSRVVRWFLSWFWPRFNAGAFVLSREQEYQADAIAAKTTSPDAIAGALLRLQVQWRWLNEGFWPDFFRRTRDAATPPGTLYHEMASGFASLHAHSEIERWVGQAFNFETSSADTHPSLQDRLTALGSRARSRAVIEPLEPGQDAASVLLGNQCDLLVREFSQAWAESVRAAWSQRHEQTQQAAVELERQSALAGERDTATLWKRATLILDQDGDEAALRVIDEILAVEPEHPEAHFVRGRYLLSRDAEGGVEHIEKAMVKNRSLVLAGCELLHVYYSRTGQQAKRVEIERRVDAEHDILAKAQAERADATTTDVFVPAELTAEEIRHARKSLAGHPEIVRAFVVSKKVKYCPELPMFVVALKIKLPWWTLQPSKKRQKLVAAVVDELAVRGHWLVFVDTGNLRRLGRKIRAVPRSLLYGENKRRR
jgi:Zn-dependent protease with chaperone function